MLWTGGSFRPSHLKIVLPGVWSTGSEMEGPAAQKSVTRQDFDFEIFGTDIIDFKVSSLWQFSGVGLIHGTSAKFRKNFSIAGFGERHIMTWQIPLTGNKLISNDTNGW